MDYPSFNKKNTPLLYSVSFSLGILFLYFYLSLNMSIQFIWTVQISIFFLPSFILLQKKTKNFHFIKVTSYKNMVLFLSLAILLSLGFHLSLPLWEYFFPVPLSIKEQFHALFHKDLRFGFFLDILLFALIPGISEEFFFRGVIQSSLQTSFNSKTSLLITSFIFALLHFNPWYFIFYFLLGLFFGISFNKGKSLIFPILCHVVNNTIAIGYYYLTLAQ